MSDDDAPAGPQLGREVAAPRPRLRPQFVIALIAVLGLAVVVLLVRPRGPRRASPTSAGLWFARSGARCNPLEVDVLLRETIASPADRAMCLAVAGRITQARAVLDAMPEAERDATVNAIFSVAHPIADRGDDLSAGPIMGLVIAYQPANYMAMFHAGMAEFALGRDDAARDLLNRFLAMYPPRDVWRARAEKALADIAADRPLDEREAHFAE